MSELTQSTWEKELELRQLISNPRDESIDKAYICSPCCNDSEIIKYQNIIAAKYYMYYASKHMNVHANAPHAYLPVLLNDKHPAERSLALEFGLRLLELCDMLLVCGTNISNGMYAEIIRALNMEKPVFCYHPLMEDKINAIISREKLARKLFAYNHMYPALGSDPSELIPSWRCSA